LFFPIIAVEWFSKRNEMEKTPDKRKLERGPFSYPVLIEYNDPDSGSFGPVQLRAGGVDINSNGIGILAEKPVNPGGVVKVYLPLGDPKTMIATFSEVRWTKKSEGNYRMGLHFIV
jgi:hypothetical protein